MKIWFVERFKELYQPKIGVDKSILNEKVMVAKPFDLILKVMKITKTNIGNFKSTILFKLVDDTNN